MKAKSIRFEGVSKHYGHSVAVDKVSFSVEAGTLMTLLGPSGCGKTTTLRMIAGLEIATSGRILIGDDDVTHVPASERDVSMVFQSYALFPHMTVFDNVAYGLKVRSVDKAQIGERVRKAIATVGLAGFEQRLPSQLSGGQQQRVAVARALVLEPSVLLFDEPLSNLDARLRRQMREEIRDLQQRLGLTVVYVTHDQAEAMAVSDRVIVMNKSVIAQEGTPDELYRQPASRFVAGFMGEANHVRGVLQSVGDQWADLQLGAVKVRVPRRDLSSGEVEVAVRPEAVLLSEEMPSEGGLPATVTKAAYLGSLMEYTLSSELGELFAISAGWQKHFPVGQKIHVRFEPQGVVPLPAAA